MNVRSIMTRSPACCTPDTPLQDVACQMVECDCGEIPVVDSLISGKVIGVVTDRDITCRMVAQGKNALLHVARDCMSAPVITISESQSADEACRLFEVNQIRRLPVVDGQRKLVGMVSIADVSRLGVDHETAEVVTEVSRQSEHPSLVGSAA